MANEFFDFTLTGNGPGNTPPAPELPDSLRHAFELLDGWAQRDVQNSPGTGDINDSFDIALGPAPPLPIASPVDMDVDIPSPPSDSPIASSSEPEEGQQDAVMHHLFEGPDSIRFLLQSLWPNAQPLHMMEQAPAALFDPSFDTDAFKHVLSTEGEKQLVRGAVLPGEQLKCLVMHEMLEEGDETISLPCGHRFGADAILHWLKEEKACCPTCRHKMPSVEVRVETDEESGAANATDDGAQGEDVDEGDGPEAIGHLPVPIQFSMAHNQGIDLLGSMLQVEAIRRAQEQEEMMLQQVLFETYMPHGDRVSPDL